MTYRKFIPVDGPSTAAVALILAAALLAACSPRTGGSAPQSKPGAAANLSIGEIQLGTRLGSHGGIAQGAEGTVFAAGETIHIALRLRDAPQGTVGKVVWKSPAGEALGEETKRLLPGQDYMNFSADGGSLPAGSGYHAEVSVGGQPVKVLSFDLIAGG